MLAKTLYNFFMYLAQYSLNIIQYFHPKVKKFIQGRKYVFEYLETQDFSGQVLWVHMASLGEYELTIPVLIQFKDLYPTHKVVFSFFSPSGYEACKDNPITDIVCYLPLDTQYNAKRFISAINPNLVFFVKNEFWINHLEVLFRKGIKTYMLSGIFRKNHWFFKSYGRFYRDVLQVFSHFFVMNTISKKLLNEIGFENVSVTGSTDFDRVFQNLEDSVSLSFVEHFLADKPCVISGSSYSEDDTLLNLHISQSKGVKYIIVPHEIHYHYLDKLKKNCSKKIFFYSKRDHLGDLSQYDVMILDAIGILSKLYKYASVVYIGGGMRKGWLHNILEPSVFKKPIIIGKHYKKFPEALDLIKEKGVVSIQNSEELFDVIEEWLNHPHKAIKAGEINFNYLNQHKGASQKVVDYLSLVT